MYIAIHECIIYVILQKLAIYSKILNNVICLGKWEITCTAMKKVTTQASCSTLSPALEILGSFRY
jgi:hypothetical protein